MEKMKRIECEWCFEQIKLPYAPTVHILGNVFCNTKCSTRWLEFENQPLVESNLHSGTPESKVGSIIIKETPQEIQDTIDELYA